MADGRKSPDGVMFLEVQGGHFGGGKGLIGGLSGLDGALSVDAGYNLGSFFNDPRSLWKGYSPVYWYSILIWEEMEM